ncbi:MAG: zinc-binding dehydrogenase [Parvibaculaceae bacterium]|nr:zinc-binding dehydrogenase [Parvibaculaceae bacterium]
MSTGAQIQSKITSGGQLEISIEQVDMPTPGASEVVVRMEAAPINPSDMGPLFGPADIRQAKRTDAGGRVVLSAPVPEKRLGMVASRFDMSIPVGNEGAGIVIAAGEDAAAQALMGKTVAVLSGSAYSQYCCVPVASCLPHNDGTTPRDAASSFVNPLTALGMVETMKLEGHTALVHTAAASNLGQMLNKICLNDGVELVNIVRNDEQTAILKAIGAKHICDSSKESFMDDLVDALAETGATLAFDAIGGGRLVNTILVAMERAASRGVTGLNTYGSTALKQVYLYGGLDISPTTLDRNYGMAWGIGGWLLPLFLGRVGAERAAELQARVAREIKTTFASSFTKELSLEEALDIDNVQLYVAKKTGEKYLINPNKGA